MSKNDFDNKAKLAAAMLYEHRLNQLGLAFDAKGLSPVVVKGQAIVDLAMNEDDLRISDDVDLLVEKDASSIMEVLLSLGYQEMPQHSRNYKFAERSFLHSDPGLPVYVEVHCCLDKIILRPIPYTDILARARKSKRPGLRYPAIEDLLLLVVLHASADMFFDASRVEQDLKNLIEYGKPDMSIVRSRAQEWQLSRALDRLLRGKYSKRMNPRKSPGQIQITRYFIDQIAWHDSFLTVFRGLMSYGYARFLDKTSA